MERHGLMSFIIHPDYIIRKRVSDTYKTLLECLAELRSNKKVWIALPRELNTWWRLRNQMKLIWKDGAWQIEGPGSELASLAYAVLDGDGVAYEMGEEKTQRSDSAFNTTLREGDMAAG